MAANGVALGLLVGLAVLVVVSVVLVARGRRPRPPGTLPDPYRVRGRSMAGWQRSAIREIRRAGRQSGRRTRRRR